MIQNQCEIPIVPLQARRGSLCFRCWMPSQKLTKCSGCRRIYYCSKACQKLDWNLQHKKHCKLLRQTNAVEEKATARSRSWSTYQESLYEMTKFVACHSPDDLPRDVVQGQPYCSTCFRSGIQAATVSATLTPCEICHMVFTCSECKPSHSNKQCLEYQSRNQVETYRITHFAQSGQAQCRAPTETPRSEHLDLSSVSNWMDYLARVSGKDFVRTFTDQHINLLNVHEWEYPENFDIYQRSDTKQLLMYHLLATDTLTMPLSIVAALEDSDRDILTKQTLSVHVVGAETKELLNLMMFEEMLHLLPSLRHLKITLIGPTKVGDPEDRLSQEMPCNVCQSCSRAGRTRTTTVYQGVYHDFATNPKYQRPDIAVLFHSGRTQEAQASWRPTTRFLVESGTLTLCTTYNLGEATEEVAELDSIGANFIFRPDVNKWQSLVPLPDFNEGPEHGLYYHNFYRYIFQGRR